MNISGNTAYHLVNLREQVNNLAIPTMFCLRIPWRKQGPQWNVPHGSCLWKSYRRDSSPNLGFPLFYFFLNQLTLKCSLHTINYIHLKCTVTEFWQMYIPTIIKILNSFITPKMHVYLFPVKSCPVSVPWEPLICYFSLWTSVYKSFRTHNFHFFWVDTKKWSV